MVDTLAISQREKLQEEQELRLRKSNGRQRALRKLTRVFGKVSKWFKNK